VYGASNGQIVPPPRDDSIYEFSHLIPVHTLVPLGSSQRVREKEQVQGGLLVCVYGGSGTVAKSQPLLAGASVGGQLEPLIDAEWAAEDEVEAVIEEP